MFRTICTTLIILIFIIMHGIIVYLGLHPDKYSTQIERSAEWESALKK